MLLKATFESIGKYVDLDGKEQTSKTAHFVIGKREDDVSGGLYLPVGMEFPAEGITVRLDKKKGGQK